MSTSTPSSTSNHIVDSSSSTLREVLTSKEVFEIPDYQRPYAWEDKHVSRLLEDLHTAWSESKEYFMGSVVIAGKPDDRKVRIIDGQQRLTTLFLLIAASKRMVDDSGKNAWSALLFRGPGRARLSVRQEDRTFFSSCLGVSSRIPAAQSDSQSRMRQSFKTSEEFLMNKERFPNQKDAQAFLEFVLDKGVFVIIHASEESTALRMFQTLNATGLDLSNADLIKAWLLSLFGTNAELRADYAAAWDRLVEDVSTDAKNPSNFLRNSADEVETMLGFVRTLYNRKRQERGLYDEWVETFSKPRFAATDEHPCPVFDDIVNPLANAYRDIEKADISSNLDVSPPNEVGRKIKDVLQWLNRVDFSDWRLVVLALYRSKVPVENQVQFLSRFERLVAYLLLSNKRTSTRLARYFAILDELDSWEPGEKPFESKSVELTRIEVEEFLRILDGDIYNEIKGNRVKYLFSRINSFLDESGTWIPFERLSIEHVLPQTPTPVNDDIYAGPAGPQWNEWWTRQEEDVWTHRLGNLIPLSLKRNIKASNFTFQQKRRVYLNGVHGDDNTTAASAFLTRIFKDGPKGTWTPRVVEENHSFLLGKCIERWDLHPETAPMSVPRQREDRPIDGKKQRPRTQPSKQDSPLLPILRDVFGDELILGKTNNQKTISFRTKRMDALFPPENAPKDRDGYFYQFGVRTNGDVSLWFHPQEDKGPKKKKGVDQSPFRNAVRKRLPSTVWENLISFPRVKALFDGKGNDKGSWVGAFTWSAPKDSSNNEMLVVRHQLELLLRWTKAIITDKTGTKIVSLPTKV